MSVAIYEHCAKLAEEAGRKHGNRVGAEIGEHCAAAIRAAAKDEPPVLNAVNGISPESILRYLEFILCRRYQTELISHDFYKGAKGSSNPLMGAHYELNNAASVLIFKLAKQHLGVDIAAYSRGRPGVPDTRTFLSDFEEAGINFEQSSK